MSYRPNLLTEISFDAGSRLRVGQITSLGELKTLNEDDLLLWENAGTGAASAWADNKYTLSVASGQYQIRRSRHYFPYFSGKSQQVEITLDGFQTQSGVTKRAGYFSSNAVAPYDSDKDGFWIEDDGATKYLKVSRRGTETLSVPMASWNGDKDILTYDWSKFTVVLFDFLWLGGAVLRVFVKIGGSFSLVHQFDYAGTVANTFTHSPNHAVRAEARGVSDGGTMRLICAQVSTEGSVEESGKQRAVDTGHVAYNLTTIGTTYPIVGVRKKITHRDRQVKLVGLSAFVTTNADHLLLTLQRNPTLSAPLVWTDVANSAAQQGLGDGTKTVTSPGEKLFSLVITQGAVLPPDVLNKDFLSSLGVSVDNVSDELILCGTPITATVGTFGVLVFKEY